ncbi:hypothetical protein [Microbispora siamensis]|uniref:Uncharacterized protein n=1 Tax=Microbispora siamensis TaxID=564413 RepID=A0ABQ4GGS8_9ACTN|nr:hypothetical protein [Microbispora siamensis]GIH60652.1 hypothetical protein Msi02_14690 [Microbispora siamensis]
MAAVRLAGHGPPFVAAMRKTPPWSLAGRSGHPIDEKLVKELVIDSYRLVVGGLPTSEQPVDPRTYGRRA